MSDINELVDAVVDKRLAEIVESFNGDRCHHWEINHFLNEIVKDEITKAVEERREIIAEHVRNVVMSADMDVSVYGCDTHIKIKEPK